jgi:3-deoxy-D-manno-octulosonate 8-phosphate phosphatase (KDO 8-P phosphatase)
MSDDLKQKLQKVKAIYSDVDGILTDGSFYLGPDHYELKRFTVNDGVGAALARHADIPLALISARHSEATTARAEQLGIKDVYQGNLNKLEALHDLLKKHRLDATEVVYIGDGLVDLPVMEEVGVPVSVPDAPDYVREVAVYITSTRGGDGVLKEVLEWVLENQGRLAEVVADMRRKIYLAGA